jgi:hypothetical protein
VFKLLFALHLLFAIFAIGPLVHAATTASRGVRTGDGAATASAARMLRIYSYTSVLVVLVGMGLMSLDDPDGPGKVAEFKDLWIWLSVVLWLVAIAVTLFVLVPMLTKVTETIRAEGSVASFTARVAAVGSGVAVIFTGIVFLMVYQPGS